MIDAVIFDWGGTLTPWHSVDAAQAWITGAGDPEIGARLWEAELAMWQRSQTEHRSAALSDVFAAAGVDFDEAMITRYHEWWEPHTFIDPDAPELFEALRARDIKIGVLSNTIWSRAEHERIFARDLVSEHLDGAVYTSDIAWTKPHPEAFLAAMAAVGVVDPSRVVFVGDRPWDDIHGAKSVGMRTILVPHSEIPESQRGPVEAEADAVVQRLGDVLAHVDLWRET